MENRYVRRLVAGLIAVCLLLSGAVGWLVYERIHVAPFAGQAMQQAMKYTLYVGTNDAATNTQTVPTEELQAKVDAICEKYVGGFTIAYANGNWFDSTGTKVRENTLVYYIYNATDEQIGSIMDEVLTALHQNELLLEKTNADIIFYSGGAQ